MLNFKRALFFICFVLFAFPLKASEYIEHFHSDIMVNPDGSLNIEETITIHHEGFRIKRGICRDLSTSKGESYKILNVMRNGENEHWFTEKQTSLLRLNTESGKPLENPGTSTYVINYIMYDALRPIRNENLNELYLNITGKSGFPINHVTAEVHYPPKTGVIRQYSYQTNQTRQEYLPDKPFEFFNLAPQEQVTIAQAFTKGTVNVPFPKIYRLLIISFILMLIYFMIAWHFWGRDPTPKAVVPDWEIPKDLSPLDCAFINKNGEAPGNSFFLHIIWLLQQKIINIMENKGTHFMQQKTFYTLTTNEKPKDLNKEVQLYYKNFPNVLTLASNPSNRLAQYQQDLIRQTRRKLENKSYHKREWITTIGALIMPLTCFYLFPDMGVALYMMFILVASPAIFSRKMWPLYFVTLIITPILYLYIASTGEYLWPAIFYGYFVLLIVFTHLMFQPTPIGQRQKEKIEGLKMFLKAVSTPAHAEESPDENEPEKKPVLSKEKRLTPKDMDNLFPYAVALGLEKEWSKKYQAIFGSAALALATHDIWHNANFKTNFSNTCKTAASLPPSASSGGGSFGRGFAGGGFGGGGVGGR